MASKFYAVRVGRTPGVYTTWNDAKKEVNGYPGAVFKSFPSLSDAQSFLHHPIVPALNNPNMNNIQLTTVQTPLHESKIIYTDGSCINYIGGFGIVEIENDQEVKSFYGRCPGTATNQIAELYAIKNALTLYSGNLTIYTDSQYSINCLTNWYKTWQHNGWKNSKNESVANQELIKEILELQKNRDIIYQHVYGHRGDRFNERADQLANIGRQLCG